MSRSLALLRRQHLEQDHYSKVAQITSIYSHIYTTQDRTLTKSVDDTMSFYKHRCRADNHFFMVHWTPPTQATTLSNQSDMNMHIYSGTVAINVSMTLTSNI